MIPSPLTLSALTRSFPTVDIDYPALLERGRKAYSLMITVVLWAIAITFTAGRYARRVFEYARPHLAQLLSQLALALDGSLAYPDQPEPEPIPVPVTTPSRKTRRAR